MNGIRIKPYMTRRRMNTLESCHQYLDCEEDNDIHNISKYVDYIFADVDGNLKFRLHKPFRGKQFFFFRTEEEFLHKVELSIISQRDDLCERSMKHFVYN